MRVLRSKSRVSEGFIYVSSLKISIPNYCLDVLLLDNFGNSVVDLLLFFGKGMK
mgnify:CR=1 FL=1